MNVITSATLQHIELLSQKRMRLEEAQLEAEEQFCQETARRHAAGELSWENLCAVYRRYRLTALPGFSKRWNAVLPVPAGRLVDDRFMPNEPDGSFSGQSPLTSRCAAPAAGQSVVYVLFDRGNAPCYVGSSGNFRERLRRHRKDGKQFHFWRAVPVNGRDEAYRLEHEWLASYKPYLNKRS